MNPLPLTPRLILEMHDGFDRSQWNYLSHVLAEIFNSQPGVTEQTAIVAPQRNPYGDFEMLIRAKGAE